MGGGFFPPAHHGHDNRDGGEDQISGDWWLILDAGDSPPETWMDEGEDYLVFEGGATQPPPGSGPGGDDLEEFAVRRGLSKLDSKGHVDCSAVASGSVILTLPEGISPPKGFFRPCIIYDGATPQMAMMTYDSATREISVTFPV